MHCKADIWGLREKRRKFKVLNFDSPIHLFDTCTSSYLNRIKVNVNIND